MFYKGKNMNLEEYWKTRMIEEGFEDPYKTDYSCSEEEVWIIQDYYGSCGIETKEDFETLDMLGYELSWLEEDEERLDELYALKEQVTKEAV